MNKVFIFDVDGTLTPSRRPMDKKFAQFLKEWAKTNTYWLVSGSNIEKMDEQVPEDIMIGASGLFCCGGNELWEFDPHIVNFPYNRIYEKKFKPPETLLTYLGFQVKLSETPVMSTNHREDRGSMINFSTVGRDCTLEERAKYFEWDNQVGERKKIAKEINEGWPKLDAVIGGQISIDIAQKGRNKSQILQYIMGEPPSIPKYEYEYIFMGDRTEEGGNDYPLANLMEKTDNCKVHQVDGYRKTWWLLERYKLELEKLSD